MERLKKSTWLLQLTSNQRSTTHMTLTIKKLNQVSVGHLVRMKMRAGQIINRGVYQTLTVKMKQNMEI